MTEHRLDKRIRETLAIPVPDDIRDRLHRQTDSFQPDERKSHMWAESYLKRLVLVAALLVLTGTGVWWAIRASQPVDAFARVAEQLRTLKTMSYTLTPVMNTNGLALAHLPYFYRNPGMIRIGGVDDPVYNVTDFTTSKGIQIDHAASSYELSNDRMPSGNVDEWFETLYRFPETYDAVLGEEDIDGLLAYKYRVTFQGQELFVWIASDAKLVRIEYSPGDSADGTPSSTILVMTDIRINPDLPDSLFDMTPPPGYTQIK